MPQKRQRVAPCGSALATPNTVWAVSRKRCHGGGPALGALYGAVNPSPSIRLGTERADGEHVARAAPRDRTQPQRALPAWARSWHSMDDGFLPMRPQVVVAAYLLAALCLLIPLAVLGSTFAGTVLWRRGLRPHGAAVVGLGVACTVLGVAALR